MVSMGWRGVRESTHASSVHVRAAVGACPIAVTPACTYTRQQTCESRGYTIIDEAWRRESWRWRDRKRATTVPRPRPPMAPRKPSFPKPILPRPIVKPAGGAKCCAWMRAHPYQKRCFRRRGPRHITERRHAATPSSLNRWLAHPIPPALYSGRCCFCSCLSSYRVGWHGRGTEAASEASAVMKSVSEAVCTNNAHARAKQRIRRDPKLPPCGK